MSMLNNIARLVTRPMPRTVGPKAHAIVNYIAVGTFLAGAGLFWRRNKRAAVAALLCGGAELALTLLTDTPGGVERVISFSRRRAIDTGLAAMFATMPDFLAFSDEKEKGFFLLQGAVLTGLAELTQFPEVDQPAEYNDGHLEAA